MRSRSSRWSTLLALSLLAAPLAALPNVPGAEQRVNQRENLSQRNPVAAFFPSGASLVVWENNLVGLQGRLFDAAGRLAGGELTLVANNALTTVPSAGDVVLRKSPAIAPLPSGRFLLFWTEERAYQRVDYFIQDYELQGRDVFGQLFDADGKAAGPRFRVNVGTAGLQSGPQVARRGNEVLVAWSLDDREAGEKSVLVRRFDAAGQALSGEVRVNPAGVAAESPSLAADAAGRFLVAWNAEDGDGRGIFAQLFDRDANPVGSSFRVNADIARSQRLPAVAAANGGGFLVVWNAQLEDRHFNRIYGQLVGPVGNLVGGQFAVSGGNDQKELAPAVVPAPGNRFFVAWLTYRDIFPTGVYGVVLDADGARVNADVKLNRRRLGANQRLTLATDGKGGYLIPWEGFTLQKAGISAQRAN